MSFNLMSQSTFVYPTESTLSNEDSYRHTGTFQNSSNSAAFDGNLVLPLAIYETTNKTESVADIHQKNAQINWKASTEITPQFDKIYWLKTKLVGNATFNGEQLFHVSNNIGTDREGFDYVTTYISKEPGKFDQQQTGGQVLLKDRPYVFWATFIKMDVEIGDTLEVYIKLEGLNPIFPMQVIHLWHIDKKSLFPSQINKSIKATLFFGILGIQLLFFLCLFFIEKEKMHGYFVLLVLGLFMTRAFHIGNFDSFVLFPFWINHHAALFFVGSFLAQLGGLLFTKQYFGYSNDSFLTKKVLPFFLTVLFIDILIVIILGYIPELTFARFYYLMPHGLLIFTGGVLELLLIYNAPKSSNYAKKILLIALAPILLSLSLVILADLQITELGLSYEGTNDLFRLSIILMLVSLSLIIGHRTNLLKAEKTKAIEQNLIDQQAIREKELQTEQLKEINQMRNQLYVNITHEFRTPLTVITGMATQLKQDPHRWLEQGVAMIERNADNLLNLVNQLLDLSKLESGKMKVSYQQGNIITYLKYLVETVHSLAVSKNITVHFHSEEDLIMMDFDENKLQKIIINLLSNAVKFTPESGHIYVVVQHIKEKSMPKGKLQIKVRDTGKGISEKQLPYIFDRFYQIDGTTTREGEGTGVGLALVKELVGLMEGTITVKSKIQRETEFTLLLPIHNDAVLSSQPITLPSFIPKAIDTKSGKILAKTALTDTQIDKQKVLIIEDNADVVAYMFSCLEKEYHLQVGSNGEEGIELALAHIPDIIITDIMMPIKDGLVVCQTLKADTRTSHIPIIMLTAKADIDSKLAGLKQGADAYLSKPFHPKELLIRLEGLIQNRKRLQAKYKRGQIIVEPKPKTEAIFLQKVQQTILDNLTIKSFGPNELARALGTSRTQLHRKLKALTDISTSHYINQVKLQEGKRLLLETEMNISEIAFAVGFTSVNYFSNNFSKAFGSSPRAFRNNEVGSHSNK